MESEGDGDVSVCAKDGTVNSWHPSSLSDAENNALGEWADSSVAAVPSAASHFDWRIEALEFYAGGGGVVYIPKGDTDLSPGLA